MKGTIMKIILLQASILSLTVIASSSVFATSIIMEGDYIKTAVSDNGTLGYGSHNPPGILHDISGTGTFDPAKDYLTYGSPREIFSVSSVQSGKKTNNNSGSTSITKTSLLDTSGIFDNALSWSGVSSGFFEITNDYFYNDGDERIGMTSTITALTDLTGLSFLRELDPDQDGHSGDTSTNNTRGHDANNDGDYLDAGDIAPEDFVHTLGPITGLTIGLFSDSNITHNTGVTSWTTSHSEYLSGTNIGNGDNTIGLAFDIGSLLMDNSVTLEYSYVMGENLDEAVAVAKTPPAVAVPEPSSFALFGLSLVWLGFMRKRKQVKV
jgi:hypothetical protein